MTKSKNRLPTEESLILPTHPQLQHLTPAQLPIVDTHTHILSTYSNCEPLASLPQGPR
jgi:hypothetical protein